MQALLQRPADLSLVPDPPTDLDPASTKDFLEFF
jgi:hypothetical protein